MKALVVDDQKSMRMITATIFEQMGHEVVQAENGEKAIDTCRREAIDLVLLDVEMPGINGFETALAIREQSSHWFPIIFLSAQTEPEFFIQGIRSGGDIYLFKPIVPEVLQAMINAMERISQSHRSLQNTKAKLESIAYQDALTGLVNRRGFDESLESEIENAQLNDKPLSLMLVDVDKFKPYNDNLGHPAGDACLKKVAKLLLGSMCRDSDIVARYGGEEFGIILPNTDFVGAKKVGERICDAFHQEKVPHGYSEVADYVTVSGGLVCMNQGAESANLLLESADQKLYQAKEQGRARILG